MSNKNTGYSNFFLSNEVEDQFESHLNMQQFCTVDRSLQGTAGMTRKINVYSATDGTEKVGVGEGNTKSISVSHEQKEYKILLAQNRFEYYDEEAMDDPMIVPIGMKHAGTDMFNTVNADIFGEFKKATLVVPVSAFDFDAFVDAQSLMALENLEDVNIFSFVSPTDMANVRKSLKDDLKYVESFAKNGYVGTVGGVNLYTKKNAAPNEIILGTKEAVTLFVKKNTEIERVAKNSRSETAANTRLNTIFSRKYYLPALTNATKAVKIIKGTATATSDTAVSTSKTYYANVGNGYMKVVTKEGDNPKTLGYFEIA